MRLRYDAATEEFRDELRSWLDAHAPSEDDVAAEPRESSAHLPAWAVRFQRRAFDDGWLVPGWGPEFGGRNATPEQVMVYFEEFSKLHVARSANPQGLGIVAPSLYDEGTEEQKAQWLLPTLRAEISWCVGMSEPGAGSDLAALSTRALVEGDEFVISGQKVWTSGAHHADVCLAFVRTDPDAPRHKGISVVIVPMDAPGITCRPLPELTAPDHADFNEVFFDEVRVPRDNLVGELNRGWAMAMGSLGHERAMLWVMQATAIERNLANLLALADDVLPDGSRRGDDPAFRETVGRLYTDAQAVWFLGYKGFATARHGQLAPEHLILKLYSSEVQQRLADAGMQVRGAAAVDVSDDPGGMSYDRGSWSLLWLRSFANTIAGGTSEIQRNIIAERLLGLPR